MSALAKPKADQTPDTKGGTPMMAMGSATYRANPMDNAFLAGADFGSSPQWQMMRPPVAMVTTTIDGRVVVTSSADDMNQWNITEHKSRGDMIAAFEWVYGLYAVACFVIAAFQITAYRATSEWLTLSQSLWVFGALTVMAFVHTTLVFFLTRQMVEGTAEVKRVKQQWPPPKTYLGVTLVTLALSGAGLGFLWVLNDDATYPSATWTRHYIASLFFYALQVTWQLHPMLLAMVKP